MIDRRSFIKSAVASCVIPSLGLGGMVLSPKPDWTLRIEVIPPKPDDFVERQLLFTKGPHTFRLGLSDGQDLIDTHGVCATDELVTIAANELEYGIDNLKKLWEMPSDFSDQCSDERKKALIDLKVISLTNEEKVRIARVCTWVRGSHHCAHYGYWKVCPRIMDKHIQESWMWQRLIYGR